MKKKYFFINIIVDLIPIVLVLLNILFMDINMPEFLGVLSVLLVIAATVLFFIKGQSGRIAKVLVCIFAVFSMFVSILGTYCNPYWNGIMFRTNTYYYSREYDYELSSAEAVKDLEYAMKYLKKLHPALYKEVPDSISKRYESVKVKLAECDSISVNELAKEIESIFSELRDGHTYVRGNYKDRRIMKYYRKWFDEGYEIKAVNDIPIEELLEKYSEYYSFEVSSWQWEWLSDDIVTVAGIDYLGFDIDEGVEYTLTSEEGETRTEICYSEDFLPWNEYAKFNNIVEGESIEENFVRYEIDVEKSLAILYLDECTYNSEYIDCVHEMFEVVRNNDIKNVAVDLRYNGGGSDLVVSEFFRYLDIDSYKTASMSWRLGFIYLNLGSGISENEKYEELLFDGDVYLLTSTGTFSSAMMFAEYVKDNNLGTIIGEAPGNNPNGCGEIVCFKLPNSKIFMQISTKRFYRADKKCTDELVVPDIECNSDMAIEELYRQMERRNEQK